MIFTIPFEESADGIHVHCHRVDTGKKFASINRQRLLCYARAAGVPSVRFKLFLESMGFTGKGLGIGSGVRSKKASYRGVRYVVRSQTAKRLKLKRLGVKLK